MANIAQIIVNNVNAVTHGTTAIKGVKTARISIKKTIKKGSADGALGPTSRDGTFYDITGNLEFESEAPLVALLGYAQADLAIVGRISGGTTARTITVKNVLFRTPNFSFPAANTGDLGKTTVSFKATWGESAPGTWNTLAEMVAEATA